MSLSTNISVKFTFIKPDLSKSSVREYFYIEYFARYVCRNAYIRRLKLLQSQELSNSGGLQCRNNRYVFESNVGTRSISKACFVDPLRGCDRLVRRALRRPARRCLFRACRTRTILRKCGGVETRAYNRRRDAAEAQTPLHLCPVHGT